MARDSYRQGNRTRIMIAIGVSVGVHAAAFAFVKLHVTVFDRRKENLAGTLLATNQTECTHLMSWRLDRNSLLLLDSISNSLCR